MHYACMLFAIVLPQIIETKTTYVPGADHHTSGNGVILRQKLKPLALLLCLGVPRLRLRAPLVASQNDVDGKQHALTLIFPKGGAGRICSIGRYTTTAVLCSTCNLLLKTDEWGDDYLPTVTGFHCVCLAAAHAPCQARYCWPLHFPPDPFEHPDIHKHLFSSVQARFRDPAQPPCPTDSRGKYEAHVTRSACDQRG